MCSIMSKLKRLSTLFCIITSVALCCVIAAFAAEPGTYGDVPKPYYSTELTLTVPRFDGKISTSTLGDDGLVFKCTNDKICTFQTIENTTASGADARLINSNGESRSSWARDLLTDTTRTVSTIATKGHIYYAQISSDLLTFSNFDITFRFSPDDMT